MTPRRESRGGTPRTDRQIAAHEVDAYLIERVASGELTVSPETRMDLRRLAREDVLLAGFGAGATPTLLPRGARIPSAIRGEIALSDE